MLGDDQRYRLGPEAQQRGAGILRRAEVFSGTLDWVMRGRDNPLTIVIDDTLSAVEAVVDGARTLMFGTNSYLGLNFHPRTVEASIAATRHYGTGSTASRVASGNHRLHVDLEADLAALYGWPHAVVYSTGFMANLAVISGLAREGDAVLLDEHCHASILAAARMSGAKVRTFRHNDARDLDRMLRESDIPAAQTLVVIEGLYSVLGDIAELKSIAAAVKRHGAVLAVDEAHSFGIYGRDGRGVCQALDAESEVDVIVGTFSKSVGVIGGYSVTNIDALRSMRFGARPYLYTASLPPAVVASAREAVRLIAEEPELRATMWRNARAMHEGLSELGLAPVAAPGPVGCIRMAGPVPGYEFWKGLLLRGVYVNLMGPPATPTTDVVLRYSVSAAHTPEHIATALEVFGEVARARKIA